MLRHSGSQCVMGAGRVCALCAWRGFWGITHTMCVQRGVVRALRALGGVWRGVLGVQAVCDGCVEGGVCWGGFSVRGACAGVCWEFTQPD